MPESLPTGLRYAATFPKLVRSTSISKYGKRAISFIESGDPFWQWQARIIAMSNSNRQKLEAFIDRCRNGLVTVHYTPKHVCLPQAYWGNPTHPAIAGDGTLGAIAGNVTTITSVVAGLRLTEGDLIGFSIGEYNFIARVVQDATATGTSVAVKVEPFLPSYITTGAAVRFKNPVMNMRLVPDSYECGDGNWPEATFQLIEVPK